VQRSREFYRLTIPIVRKRGHLFVECNIISSVLMSDVQLLKIHKQFGHPSPEKLYDLISFADPETDVKKQLYKIYLENAKRANAFQETITSSSFIAERPCDIQPSGGPGHTLHKSESDRTHG
jgi:hypothetical protein